MDSVPHTYHIHSSFGYIAADFDIPPDHSIRLSLQWLLDLFYRW